MSDGEGPNRRSEVTTLAETGPRSSGAAERSPYELHPPSGGRRRRYLFAAVAVAVPFLAVALVVFVAAKEPDGPMVDRFDEDGYFDPEQPEGKPFPPGPAGPEPGQRRPTDPKRRWPTLGDGNDLRVRAAPTSGLGDGHRLEVTVDGLESLPGARFFQCAGDVTTADAPLACTATAVERPWREPSGPVVATAGQVITVSRTIQINRGAAAPDLTRPYDCAIETAGCSLAIGTLQPPVRAVLVPLAFRAGTAPVPEATVDPSSELTDGQQVELRAGGIRPNGAFVVRQCEAAPGARCIEVARSAVVSDEDGSFSTTIVVRSRLSGPDGTTDCLVATCAVVVVGAEGRRVVEIPVRFAPE